MIGEKSEKFFNFLILFFCFLGLLVSSDVYADVYGISIKRLKEISSVLKTLTAKTKEKDLLDDYIMFFQTITECRKQKLKKCIVLTEKFQRKFPDSYLIEDINKIKVRALCKAIKKNIIAPKSSFLNEINNYIKSYPFDEDTLFLYSQLLYSLNKKNEYKKIIKKLYLKGGKYYVRLKKIISFDMFSDREKLILIRNLIKLSKYKEAEKVTINIIINKKSAEILPFYKMLGKIYFKKKQYRKSAYYYFRTSMLYESAKAFYRIRRFREFNIILNKLKEKKSEQSCVLLILKGQKLRRSGDFEGAIKIFKELYDNNYPCKERALWLIAWTEYLKKDFISASHHFQKLYKNYQKDKYLYWFAKSEEKLGKKKDFLYIKLGESSFYRLLLNKWYDKPISAFFYPSFNIRNLNSSDERLKKRVMLLKKANLKKYAIREILFFVKKKKGNIAVKCFLLQRVDAWKESIKCAKKIEKNNIRDIFMYPLAYYDLVKNAADSSGLDPLLILSVMRQESMFQQKAYSVAGALGLMQLMPYTARWIAEKTGEDFHNLKELFLPEKNIKLGSIYLKKLIQDFGVLPLALAAYNAGEYRVKQWYSLFNYKDIDEFIEDIPFKETKNYTKKVLTNYFHYRRIYATVDNR